MKPIKARFKIITCVLALLGFIPYCAASDSLQTTLHDIETGLPSNHVYTVMRDRNGYTWFLTDNGIVKYNGYSYKLFNTASGMPSNDIWYLKEDSYGRLWVYTHAYEVGYIKNDKYHKIDVDTKNSFLRLDYCIEYGKHVYLWMTGALHGQIAIVDSAGSVRYMPSNESTPVSGVNSDTIVVNYKFSENRLYKAGKYGLRHMGGCMPPFKNQYSTMCVSIYPTYNTLGYYHGGADLMFANVVSCNVRYGHLREYGAADNETVYVVYTDQDKFCVVSDRHIFVIDQHYNLVKRVYYPHLFQKLVQGTYYSHDAYGMEWYATKTDGCLQVFKEKKGLHAADAFAVSELKKSRLVGRFKDGSSWWFDEMGLTLVSIDVQQKIRFRIKLKEKVIHVAESGDGGEVFIVFTNSIQRFNFDSGMLHPLVDNKSPVYVKNFLGYDYSKWLTKNNSGREELNEESKKAVTKHFSFLHQYKPGVLYGLTPYGFRRMDILPNETRIETIDAGKFNGVHFDAHHNKYWVFNKGRVLVLDPETGSHTEFTNTMLAQLGIQSVAGLKVDRFYNIYVQNADGIVVFHPFKNAVRYLNANANLTDYKIELSGDELIVAGKFGLAYTMAYGPCKFGKFDMLPNVKAMYYNRIYDLVVSDSGSVLLNSDRGHFTCDIHKAEANQQIHRSDSNVERLVLIAPFHQSLVNTDTIRLNPNADNINLDYVNYYGKGDRIFSYKIAGVSDWAQTTSGEIFLTGLDAEKYYMVSCSVKDELFRSKHYTFYIYKTPYWYQSSTWRRIFWIGGVLLFAVFILTIILVTRRVVANTNRRRQAMVDLELRAIYAQINPHFIFNTLSTALYFINEKDFDGAYNNVSKFSRLLRAYLKSSRNRYTILAEEIEMLENYVELQKDRFEEKFDYAIEVDKRLAVDTIQIPSLLLQPLVENAINHGLFHMQKDGFLRIKFEQGKDDTELICHVEDNGIGREEAKRISKASSTRQSYGTTLTSELVALFHRYEQMNIAIEYIDKAMPESGTIVKLFIRNLKTVAG